MSGSPSWPTCTRGGIAEHFAGAPPSCLFGPAYKAIPLAVATAISASRMLGHSLSYTFNRKEAKTHGEAGTLVGPGNRKPTTGY